MEYKRDGPDSVQGSSHSTYECNNLRPSRKRHSLFSPCFENGIPAGKRSRDFICVEAESYFASDEYESDSDTEDDTLGGFLVLDDESKYSEDSEAEYSEEGSDRSASKEKSNSDRDSKFFCTDSDTEMDVRVATKAPRCLVNDTETDVETDGEVPTAEIASGIPVIPESPLPHSPSPDDVDSGRNDGANSGTESETSSNISESLLCPARQRPATLTASDA
jgi:hypothetical protein